MDTLVQDFRYAIRLLTRSPLFTVVAVLTLGLGLGTNTAIFSLTNSFLLKLPGGVRPGGLVWFNNTSPRERLSEMSYPDFKDYQKLPAFSDVACAHRVPLAVSSGGEPQRIRGQVVSDNYFKTLGVRPALGRTFDPKDDRLDETSNTVVVGYALWKKQFGGGPDVIGRSITVNGSPFTVIGVAPESFGGLVLDEPIEMWVPIAMYKAVMPGQGETSTDRRSSWLQVVGRLKRGASLPKARLEARLLAGQIATAYPDARKDISVELSPMNSGVRPSDSGDVVPIMALLLGVTGLVVLIACANVGNLLLGRAVVRRREIAVRLALGATRGRLIRQLLTESVILALLGGGTGLLMAMWTFDLVLSSIGAPRFISDSIHMDGRVLLFTMIVSLVTGILFGLAPALNAVRPDQIPALREDTLQSGTGRFRSRLQKGFVAAQVALSLILLVGAGLLLRSLNQALTLNPGFDPQHTLTFAIDPGLKNYSGEKADVFLSDLLARTRQLPGVTSASLASPLPLSGRMFGMNVSLEGEDPGAADSRVLFFSTTWPEFFKTMEIPLLSGRDFTVQDKKGTPRVGIANETMASRYWPGKDPLGKRIYFPGESEPVEIVGVARDTKYDEITEDPRPYLYLPQKQNPDVQTEINLILRSDGDARRLVPSLREIVHEMDPDLPIYDVNTFEDVLKVRVDRDRVIAMLLASFAFVALILAGMGLYGAVAFLVAQRTREIGIRMALGAARKDVLVMIIGEGVRLALLGVLVGIVPALLLSLLVSKQVYGVSPADLPTFSAVAFLLLVVTVVASWFPARRATLIDPMAALRYE